MGISLMGKKGGGVMDRGYTIFDAVADLLQSSGKSTTQLERIFEKERKTIYNYKSGCCFHLDYSVLGGLNALGYRLVLQNKQTGEIFKGESNHEA